MLSARTARVFAQSGRSGLQRAPLRSLHRQMHSHAKYEYSKASFTGFLKWSAIFAGATAFALYTVDSRSAIHQYLALPILRLCTDAETSHRLGIEILANGMSPKQRQLDDEIDPQHLLEVTIFGNSKRPLTLRTPIGVAAGLDKHGQAIDGLFGLGFAYVEVGSVTPEPQDGNPKPRFFRLPKDDAVINRYGFNSEGHFAVMGRLKQRLLKAIGHEEPAKDAQRHSLDQNKVLAVNLGKNKTGDEVSDYTQGVTRFANLSDALVVNVSSPNTPGLRALQGEEKLASLLQAVVAERNKVQFANTYTPILVKIAPDLSESEIVSIAAAAKKSQIDGIIVSNTTIQRPKDLRSQPYLSAETGGLSGAPLKPIALQAIKTLRKNVGSELTIVGCGGISNGKDAIEFAKAGATFVQVYTALAYQGPGLPVHMKEEIVRELNGKKWVDIIGVDVDQKK
ncbi:Dihydroorotate dehydrogenase (quinone) [Yarrowia sp. B02]|nr:Dihydroorotate dehydrogenase (quinone) [Yarrowia sp. B02]